MRQTWVTFSWTLLSISAAACGKIKTEKPDSMRELRTDITIDAKFKEEAEQRLKALDERIQELQKQLNGAEGDSEKLKKDLNEALFLKSWESIRSIQPCGSRFPNLAINLGKRVVYPFTTVMRLKAPEKGPLPIAPLDPGEYFFSDHKECPFRVELVKEPIDAVGQSALHLTSGEVEIQRVCWTNEDLPKAANTGDTNICSTVLGDRTP